jgi:hypothetical protein
MLLLRGGIILFFCSFRKLLTKELNSLTFVFSYILISNTLFFSTSGTEKNFGQLVPKKCRQMTNVKPGGIDERNR